MIHLKNNKAQINTISTKEDLIVFIDQLRVNLENHPEEWENVTLPSYLEALSACLHDIDGYYLNSGQPIPNTPSWKVFAEILMAAKMYE